MKFWHTIIASASIALHEGPDQGVDTRHYHDCLRGAMDAMTGHFETTMWTLESMNTITYTSGNHQRVETILVGSVVRADG